MNYAEFLNFAENQPKSVLVFQNSILDPKFECLPFGIMKKCLLGIFITLEVVSNDIKFFNFGPTECELRFFKDCMSNLKFSNLKEIEFLELSIFPSIPLDRFTLDFKDKNQISLVF